MARARGANALLTGGFEVTYGLPSSVASWLAFQFASIDGLGEVQALEDSELLGNGREPQDPLYGVIDAGANVAVPVDLRLFGWWLRLLFGPPSTVQGKKAIGSWTFSANPANNSTITPDGTDFTFKTSPAAATDIQIGATLEDTIANALVVLNATADTNAALARYYGDPTNTALLNVEYRVVGTGGNAWTLAASTSPASHATVSASTLTGGSATGPYNHTFSSGAASLPSMSVEVGDPDVPSYEMSYGVMGDKLTLPFSRQAKFAATVALIAQGSSGGAASTAGSPVATVMERFTNFAGTIYRDGIALGNVLSGSLTYANNLDKALIMRGDGRIGGADPGMVTVDMQLVTKFASRKLLDLASAKTPVEIRSGWTISSIKKLTFIQHRVFLPKPKVPVNNPNGIQVTYDLKSAENQTLLKSFSAELINDVASYA